ncbi:MAG: hypothetical protein ABR585_03270 [Gemmatimonadaceae bacterium]
MSRLIPIAMLALAMPSSSFAQQAAAFSASTDTGSGSEAIFESKDAAALTAGLAPLSRTHLSKNEREVRIWYSSFGNPQFLVIIRQNGATTTGRMLLWWDAFYEANPTLESNPAYADVRVDNFVRKGYDCGPITKRDSHFGEDSWISSICEAKLKGTPDWNAFLAEVESHALPQSSGLVSEDQSDGGHWGITVERKSGPNYGFSHYHTALTLSAPEPGRGPKLQDMMNALASTARRESAVAQH